MNDINLLNDLIEYKSYIKEDANNALYYCVNWLKDRGLEPIVLEKNGFKSLVCRIGTGNKTIIFNGHLDVVSGKEEQFSPKIEGSKLYGRGSCDMKGGVAAMMLAMEELNKKKLECEVMLQLVTDEEISGDYGSGFLTENEYIGDFVICGEPTNLCIGVQAKGILQLDIEAYGKSARGSRPWQGENAIIKAYEIYNKIMELPFTKEHSELYEKPSVNFSKIEGGDAYNKVPDYCKMCLDIRFLPYQNKDDLLKQIKSIPGVNLVMHSYGDAVKTSMRDMYVLQLKKTIEKFENTPVKLFGQHGAADTRYFSKLGIPAVEFGPCGDDWHGDCEYVDLNSVFKYKDILVSFIEEISFNKKYT